MRDFELRGIEHDLMAAEARHADRLAIRRAILDAEARQARRLLPWMKNLAVRLGGLR